MAPDDSIFRVRGLTKVYGTEAGEVRALRGVDLDARRGQTIVLLGPSGSGKSTLLNILGGLDRATDGHVVFHDARDEAFDTEGREIVAFPLPGVTAVVGEIGRDVDWLHTEDVQRCAVFRKVR